MYALYANYLFKKLFSVPDINVYDFFIDLKLPN